MSPAQAWLGSGKVKLRPSRFGATGFVWFEEPGSVAFDEAVPVLYGLESMPTDFFKNRDSQMEMPERRAIFSPDEANFCGHNWFMARKFTDVWGKNRRRCGVFNL